MAKIVNWINRDGIAAFRGSQSLSRTNISKLRSFIESEEAHMRVGKFAVIIGRDADGKQDVIAAPIYDALGNTHLIDKSSKYFDVSKRDRLRQVAQIEQFVTATANHPMKDAIMHEIEVERMYFA
jgi:hypothetical protein